MSFRSLKMVDGFPMTGDRLYEDTEISMFIADKVLKDIF